MSVAAFRKSIRHEATAQGYQAIVWIDKSLSIKESGMLWDLIGTDRQYRYYPNNEPGLTFIKAQTKEAADNLSALLEEENIATSIT